MKNALVLLVAAAAVGVPAVASSAHEIPPPVVVTTFACPSNYREILRAGNNVVCLSNISAPSVRVTTNGCGTGETAYLVDGRYGVCTKP